MKPRLLILLAVAVAFLQTGFLGWTIASRASILRNGTEIALSLAPVDPRDLLRGDYVRLSYNISRLPKMLFAHPPQDVGELRERAVHVRLRPDETGIWQPSAASLDSRIEPPPAAGEVDVVGRTLTAWDNGSQDIFATYGIERYFVPEGEGRELETNPELRSFIMRVAVGRDGTAQVKALYDGEKLIYQEPLY